MSVTIGDIIQCHIEHQLTQLDIHDIYPQTPTSLDYINPHYMDLKLDTHYTTHKHQIQVLT